MQSRIPEKVIHSIVKKKLSKGPSNMGDSGPVLFELSTFGRVIADYMFKRVEHYFSLDQKLDKSELHLLDHACHALMGEVYETGSCGQHASVALLEYLKRGVDKPVEYIQFYGESHNNHEVNHAVVTTGRNADYSKDVNKWGMFYVIDAWSDNSFSYPDTDSVDSNSPLGYPKQFYNFFKSINGLYFNCRFEKNITSQQWQKLADFFKFLSNFNEDNLNQFSKMRSSKFNVSKELSLIHTKIQEYIDVFSKLAARPHLDKANVAENMQKPVVQKVCNSKMTDNEAKAASSVGMYSADQFGLFQSVSEKYELPSGLPKEMIKEGAEELGKYLKEKTLPDLNLDSKTNSPTFV